MRDRLRLEQLPENVLNGVLASRSVEGSKLNLIEEGKWFSLEAKPYEMKVDIFFYMDRFWKHTKSRTRKGNVWQDFLDDPELIQVFPRTKPITVYE